MRKEKPLILLAVDDNLKKELVKEADKKGLSLSAYVRMILIERKK